MHLCDVMRRETSKGADLLLGVWWVVYLCCTGSLLIGLAVVWGGEENA